jgi:protein O-GlcNAc transferase
METAEVCWQRGERAREAGRLAEAVADYRRVLALVPDFPSAYVNLAVVRQASGEALAALASIMRAVTLVPERPLLQCNLGAMRLGLGRPYAEAHFRKALVLDPALAQAWLNLGAAHQVSGRFTQAVSAAERALALVPFYAEAWNNLGNLLLETAAAEAAIQAFRRALLINPAYRLAQANLINALHLADGITPEDELAECRRFAQAHAASLDPTGRSRDPTGRSRDPGLRARARASDRPLRVGYVGADGFRRHTAAASLLPLLEAHDRSQVEAVCYSDVPAEAGDAVTARFARAARLVSTAGLSDADLAGRIRADGIDIAVDVIGYPAGSRLLALAERPAPVQVNLLLMGSFGMEAIDFAIGDPLLTPKGAEAHFSERLERVDLAFVWQPLIETPAVSIRASDAPLVFGSFNQAAKLSPRCLATWARLLTRVPEARLILRGRAYGDPAVARRVETDFARHGIASERLELRGWTEAGHLEAYGEIDIALDTFPYGGVITTCEALWMGVPVVSLEGERVLGRYGAAFLKTLGLAELAVPDAEAYVEAAVRLASDRAILADLRSGLRARMSASRLCDGAAFAREIEKAYRRMWQQAGA